jgi:hypothetical protein
VERRFDLVGRLDGTRVELGDGSVRYPARLTRVGVFDYGDHKELRRPEDVFDQEALDSFKGLTVTDGHRAWVDAENWDDLSLGHVGDDVRRDGDYVAASIILKDASAIARADARELVEISMGYGVNLVAEPGETESGEKYDSIQTNIRGNHAALGPDAWGRAGANVRLLDAAYPLGNMADPVKRIDAPASNEDQTRKDLDAARSDAGDARKERDDARAQLADANKRADKAEAERDAAKQTIAKLEDEAKKVDAKIAERVALVDSARSILGADFSFAGKSDRDVRIAALAKVDPAAKFDGKPDGYIEARFDLAVESVGKERKSLAEVNEVTTSTTENADSQESDVEKARRESQERTANAWKPKAKKS